MQHELFLSFSRSHARYFRGFEWVLQRCFFSTTLPMSVKWRQNGGHGRNRPVFSAFECELNNRGLLGYWTFRKLQKVSWLQNVTDSLKSVRDKMSRF